MRKSTKRLISIVVLAAMVVTTIISSALTVFAEEGTPKKILALGESLSEEQKQLVIDYLNVDLNDVEVITITNLDEHGYLDNVLDSKKIGTKTYSCCYIEPTTEGGIHVKTVNLSYVTSEMVRNAMITSGIENANVICVSPFEVSGTGSLTGIFKAYEGSLDEEKIELASEELIETLELTDEIGDEDATAMIEELKEKVVSGEIDATSEESILDAIDKYITEHNLVLTEERKLKIAKILLKIAGYDYDIDTIRNSYHEFKSNLSNGIQKTKDTISFIEKVAKFFSDLWAKITGTYEEVSETEAYQKGISILENTKDNLLNGDIKITGTDDIKTVDEIVGEIEEEKKDEEENKGGIWNWFSNIINKSYDNMEENLQNAADTESSENVNITFEIEGGEEENITDTETESVLDYIEYEDN